MASSKLKEIYMNLPLEDVVSEAIDMYKSLYDENGMLDKRLLSHADQIQSIGFSLKILEERIKQS